MLHHLYLPGAHPILGLDARNVVTMATKPFSLAGAGHLQRFLLMHPKSVLVLAVKLFTWDPICAFAELYAKVWMYLD